jgi:hypothetical protein
VSRWSNVERKVVLVILKWLSLKELLQICSMRTYVEGGCKPAITRTQMPHRVSVSEPKRATLRVLKRTQQHIPPPPPPYHLSTLTPRKHVFASRCQPHQEGFDCFAHRRWSPQDCFPKHSAGLPLQQGFLQAASCHQRACWQRDHREHELAHERRL